jgi:tRNA-binding protein
MPPLKPQITYDDFARLDIRIGKVVDIKPFPRARNPSWKVGVDVGAERILWSSAQITNYEPAALIGSLVVCVCNFAPKNIAGFTSELLILGAKNSEGRVIVLTPAARWRRAKRCFDDAATPAGRPDCCAAPSLKGAPAGGRRPDPDQNAHAAMDDSRLIR